MSGRLLVVQALACKMRAAFNRGDLTDAQNIEAFIKTLESMDDEAYARRVALAEDSDCLSTPI